ncbi:hypothetical protein BDC45DRAFT_510093 [Circinella umbellata]|nr:hypothetical protein BDC45DRAFT_510093 [Circinella umbellata]
MRILLSTLSLIFIGREVFAAAPSRYSGDSVLLNRRLYYFGGRIHNSDTNKETLQDLIFLDISKSFSISTGQSNWQGVQVTGTLTAEPNYGYAMGVIPEEESIMLYGGRGRNIRDELLDHSVVIYNAKSNSWKTLPEPDTSLRQLEGASCSRGGDEHKAYVFGGLSVIPNITIPFTREMKIYDFTRAMWDRGPQLPENMRVRYRTPTTLVGKDLYYIGGSTANYTETSVIERGILIPMSEILVYHIEDSTWEIKEVTGPDLPQPRISHTIAAKPNSQDIVLYGGKTLLNETTPILGDVCYTLDTSSMTWKKQEISGQGQGALYGHSAVFVDDSPLLFVMFGVNSAGAVQNGFGVLDTEEWKWVDQYNSPYPPEDDSGDSSVSGDSGLSSGTIAGIVVGCVAGVALVVAFCFIRKRRNQSSKNGENISDVKASVIDINNGAPASRGTGSFKPEDASNAIPNATLSPLLPEETAPPYRGNIPNEIDPPIVLSVENTTNAQAAPRPQNRRPVKPDGE